VAQLVEALRYKPEGRGFDSWWCHWNFLLTKFFLSHSGPGVDSASNRNEYQEYFLVGKGGRCVGLTTLPIHVPNVLKSESLNLLESWGTVQACNGSALPLPWLYLVTTDTSDPTPWKLKSSQVHSRCQQETARFIVEFIKTHFVLPVMYPHTIFLTDHVANFHSFAFITLLVSETQSYGFE